VNGTAPFTNGFEIKNLDVHLDNLTGKVNVLFDVAFFYCDPDYDSAVADKKDNLYICPPQEFKNRGISSDCLDCGNITNILADSHVAIDHA
jgi:hypothetical protein